MKNTNELYIDCNGDVCDIHTHNRVDVSKEVFCELAGCYDAERSGWTEMGCEHSILGQWAPIGGRLHERQYGEWPKGVI